MWMVRPMGGLGSHMITLTQLHVLEIQYILIFMADGPVWRTPYVSPRHVSVMATLRVSLRLLGPLTSGSNSGRVAVTAGRSL